MHYYNFHIGDYKSHTHHLSLMEDLAYRRLLDHYYLHQLPIKQRDIARQIGMRDYEQEVLTVLDEFFISTESGYINPRADKEIKAFVEHQATSAYGAFVRDNPNLKSITNKQLFIEHHMAGTVTDYVNLIKSSCVVDVPIKSSSSSDDATNNQEPITNNHIKTQRGTRLPTDWSLPDSWKAWAEGERQDLNIRTVADSFKDFWIAKPGAGGVKLNWEATWRNWVRSQKQGFVAKQDIVHQTTPTPANHDAALRKIEEDRKKAAKPSAEVQAKIAELLRGKA